MSAKKRALGKGLSALLDQSGIDPQPIYDIEKDLLRTGTIGMVQLDSIDSNPLQPRSAFDEETLQSLAASIKEQGVIQPITLRHGEDGRFQLISGERRCKAARMAGLSEIPAYIILANDNSMLEMALVENIQREDLNPMEIALAYKQLIDDYRLTQERLSERLGKSRPSIANYLRLLNLPAEIQIGLRQELVSMGHARALVSINNIQTQLEVYQDIIAQNLSVRDVEEIVKDLDGAGEKPVRSAVDQKIVPELKEKYQALQKILSSYYGSKVQVKGRSGGKGSIVISFSSEQDLERILNLIQP